MEKLTVDGVIRTRLRSCQGRRLLKARRHIIGLSPSLLRRKIINVIHLIAIIVKCLDPLRLTFEPGYFLIFLWCFCGRRVYGIDVVFLA